MRLYFGSIAFLSIPIAVIILLITKERRLPTLEERNLIQIFFEAFEYRMNEYYQINPLYLKRTFVS